MKRLFRIAVIFVLLCTIAFFSFFFWASAPQYDASTYTEISKENYKAITDNDSVYSIVTYNVGYLSGMTNNKAVDRTKAFFDTNLTDLKSKLNAVNPDIIAYQEIDFNADRSYNVNQLLEISTPNMPYLAKAVNWDETYLPFPSVDPKNHFGKILSGQAVTSKYNILEQERVVLQRSKDNSFIRDAFYLDRLAQVAKLKIENKTVVIINVHLEAFDKDTRDEQAIVVLDLYKKYAKNYPTILLGDFNSDPRNKNASITPILNEKGIGNAAFFNNESDYTFNSDKPFERIDYIFYNTSHIQYVNGKVLQFGEISDHLPVEMRFKLK